MRLQRWPSATALVWCLACPSSSPRTFSEADRQAIRRTADSALAIANRPHPDWTAYARSYYAQDAISMPANTPVQVGVGAIAAAAESDTAPFNIRWELVEIDGIQDLAYVRGRWWVTIPQPTGPQPADSGNYLEVWRRQPGGAWRVARDMYSSETPPKASLTAPSP